MAVQWVIKGSKLCNLRCQYCYEFPFLADPHRISQDGLKSFFSNIATYFADKPTPQDFIWHGGEPLLLGRGYFEEAFAAQAEILGPVGVPYTNSIQTNLYRLTEDDISLLSAFSNVGVSVDVFGGLRVNANGGGSQERVLENMQRLFQSDVPFGCITVLSRATVDHVDTIYDFYAELGLSFRLLPIYRTGYSGQHSSLGLEPEEICSAYIRTFDRWTSDDLDIQVRPIEDHVTTVIRRNIGGVHCQGHYSKRPGEALFLVGTDGAVFSCADAYNHQYSYGNIFRQSISHLLQSDGYYRAISERKERMNHACSICRWFGACSGFYIGEATPEQRWYDSNEHITCSVVKPLLEHIERRFYEDGIINQITDRIKGDGVNLPQFDGHF